MSSIKDAINADLSNYEPVQPPRPSVELSRISENKKATSTIRCPLPPFNFSPDTLRQYETGGLVPQVRVIPVPVNTGGTSTVTNKVTIVSSASGSSSSGGSTTLTAKSVALAT